MPKRKLDKQSAFKDSLDDVLPKRSSKLRKLDHQDVTISPSCIRLPISKPHKSNTKAREPQIARKVSPRAFDEIDQLVVRFSFLSLETRLPFKAPGPSFPRFPLLPTEIRLMIWKLANSDSRIIKLSASKKVRTSVLDLHTFGLIPNNHVVSRIPPPSLLHACSESREVALKRYRLFFRPNCGDGGTYIDTDRDYLYYGPDEIKLLVDSHTPVPILSEEYYGDIWLRDRQAIPNILIYIDEELDGIPLLAKIMTTARWCNDLAKDVLLAGYRFPTIKEGLMLSDVGRDVQSFQTSTPETLKDIKSIKSFLKTLREIEPLWGGFKPKRMIPVALFSTDNVEQSYGFFESWHLDERAYMGAAPPSVFDIEEEDLADHIPVN